MELKEEPHHIQKEGARSMATYNGMDFQIVTLATIDGVRVSGQTGGGGQTMAGDAITPAGT